MVLNFEFLVANLMVPAVLAVILAFFECGVVMGEFVTSGWEHFHHQADIGIRGIGAARELALEFITICSNFS